MVQYAPSTEEKLSSLRSFLRTTNIISNGLKTSLLDRVNNALSNMFHKNVSNNKVNQQIVNGLFTLEEKPSVSVVNPEKELEQIEKILHDKMNPEVQTIIEYQYVDNTDVLNSNIVNNLKNNELKLLEQIRKQTIDFKISEEKVSKLQTKIQNLDSQILDLINKNNELSHEKKVLDNDLIKLEENLEKIVVNYDEKIKGLNSTISNLKEKLKTKDEELANAIQILSTKTNKLLTLQSEHANLSEFIKTLQENNATLTHFATNTQMQNNQLIIDNTTLINQNNILNQLADAKVQLANANHIAEVKTQLAEAKAQYDRALLSLEQRFERKLASEKKSYEQTHTHELKAITNTFNEDKRVLNNELIQLRLLQDGNAINAAAALSAATATFDANLASTNAIHELKMRELEISHANELQEEKDRSLYTLESVRANALERANLIAVNYLTQTTAMQREISNITAEKDRLIDERNLLQQQLQQSATVVSVRTDFDKSRTRNIRKIDELREELARKEINISKLRNDIQRLITDRQRVYDENKQLVSINKRLASSNEELASSNEELANQNSQLVSILAKIAQKLNVDLTNIDTSDKKNIYIKIFATIEEKLKTLDFQVELKTAMLKFNTLFTDIDEYLKFAKERKNTITLDQLNTIVAKLKTSILALISKTNPTEFFNLANIKAKLPDVPTNILQDAKAFITDTNEMLVYYHDQLNNIFDSSNILNTLTNNIESLNTTVNSIHNTIEDTILKKIRESVAFGKKIQNDNNLQTYTELSNIITQSNEILRTILSNDKLRDTDKEVISQYLYESQQNLANNTNNIQPAWTLFNENFASSLKAVFSKLIKENTELNGENEEYAELLSVAYDKQTEDAKKINEELTQYEELKKDFNHSELLGRACKILMQEYKAKHDVLLTFYEQLKEILESANTDTCDTTRINKIMVAYNNTFTNYTYGRRKSVQGGSDELPISRPIVKFTLPIARPNVINAIIVGGAAFSTGLKWLFVVMIVILVIVIVYYFYQSEKIIETQKNNRIQIVEKIPFT